MSKNILKNKRSCVFILLFVLGTSVWLGGCDTAYKYDITDGIDNNGASEPDITIDTEGGIDVSMYEKARIFPGLVDTAKEERINATIELDLNKQYIDSITLGVSKVPQPIYSTGLYAGAGEQVAITVEDNTMGLSVIVGSHMDDLTELAPYQRMPLVYVAKALFPGKNIIKNPLGGPIWIKKSLGLKASGTCSLKIEGVYKSPDFVIGETDLQDWKRRISETTVPWLEIRGKHFAFTVQKDRVLDNLESISSTLQEVGKEWDEAIEEFFFEYYGLKIDKDAEEKERAPEFPFRVVLDVQVLGNLYLRNSDYAIVAINNTYMLEEMLNLRTLRTGNSVALLSAINSMCTYRSRNNPWPADYRAVANAIPLYRIGKKNFSKENAFGEIFPGEENITTLFPKAIEYAMADSSKWAKEDAATKYDDKTAYKAFDLLSLIQLANYDDNNWEAMKYLNLKAKEERSIDNSTLSYAFRMLCDYFKQNLCPFFDYWGVEQLDEDRKYAEQYPLMDKKIWEYNPLNPQQLKDYDVSSYCYRHSRRDWKVSAYDKGYGINYDGDSRKPEYLIDGEKKTNWSSGKINDKPLELPYYIIFDLNKVSDIDGVYLANGYSNQCLADVHVEYIGSEVADPYDINAPWETLLQVTDPNVVRANLKNERFFDCPRTQARYLRLKISNPNTIVFKSDSDLTEEEKANQKKYHSFAEFGTYYKKP